MHEQDAFFVARHGRPRRTRVEISDPRRRPLALTSILAVVFVASLLLWRNDSTIPFTRLLREQEHEHESLFPLSSRDFWAFSLASLGLILAAGGGIGGGGMLVPIYILVLNFPPKHAIPLSNVTVFGGAVANTILNVRKRHPLADRPLIDWDLILVMEPLTILGALVGTNLNKLLPETVIVVLLVILLSLTAYKTLTKAMKLYQKETMGWSKVEEEDEEGEDGNGAEDELELVEMASGPAVPPPSPLTRRLSGDTSKLYSKLGRWNNSHYGRSVSAPVSKRTTLPDEASVEPVSLDVSESFSSSLGDFSYSDISLGSPNTSFEATEPIQRINMSKGENGRDNPVLIRILDEERQTRPGTVCTIVLLFVIVLLVNILKGGGAFPSPLGIECGSISFWVAEAIIALCICLVSWHARSSLLRCTCLKQEAGYQYLECDIEWNATSTIVYPVLSCTAGFVAGLFGIGGGIIKGPLMLALGVHPAVASATSACMILFTSFTATTSFIVFGLLVEDYAILCLSIGFAATLLGQTIMTWVLDKYQRNSYIAFCIGTVVLLSAICMTLESIISISHGANRRSSGLCSAHLE